MNFGTLKDIFLEKLIESHTTNDNSGKVLYKNFLKILKESETLRTAFIVFKNLESKTINTEISATEYLKESISLFDKYRGNKSLPTECKKLQNLLESYDVDYSKKETKPLHKYIQDLITTKKDVTNLEKIHESKSNVISWLMSEKNIVNESEDTIINKNIDPKKFLGIAVQKFNEKYQESLTEEEKNILKVLRENDEEKNKTLVSDLIKETISLVNQNLKDYDSNVTIKAKLLETKDLIYQMIENNDSSSSKVLKLYELKNNLKND